MDTFFSYTGILKKEDFIFLNVNKTKNGSSSLDGHEALDSAVPTSRRVRYTTTVHCIS